MRLRSGDKHHLRKSADWKAQIRKVCVLLTGLICAFRSADFLRWSRFIPRAQPHAQSLFLFPIVFGIILFLSHLLMVNTRSQIRLRCHHLLLSVWLAWSLHLWHWNWPFFWETEIIFCSLFENAKQRERARAGMEHTVTVPSQPDRPGVSRSDHSAGSIPNRPCQSGPYP